MLRALANIFKVPDLKRKVLFTFGIIAVYRIGAYIPTPGINGEALRLLLTEMARAPGGAIFGLMDMFTGGAMEKATIFALGIMPYISASIILQLLTVVIPHLEKLSKEGEVGRRKLTQYTRYGTVVLAIIQSLFISFWLEGRPPVGGIPIVQFPGWSFRLMTIITLTAGTAFIMWLGEQITERGIGNGISLIITISIVSRIPVASKWVFDSVRSGEFMTHRLILLIAMLVGVTVAVILITQGQRRIPVQYARRVIGRRVYGGQSTYIPLRVNQAGVIPIIFAMSIIQFPLFIAGFMPRSRFMEAITASLDPGRALYTILYVGLIIFFCYFYTAITFNPVDVADNMKKYGGFVPGIRPGRPTAVYFDHIMTRITLAGAIFLAIIAILPTFVHQGFRIPFLVASFFGGTGLLIIVGVLLDTMKQIESHLLMRHYEGFMKRGKIRGRR